MPQNNVKHRFKRAWDVFFNKDPTNGTDNFYNAYSYRPDRPTLSYAYDQSIVAAVLNRISVDVSAIDFKHVRTDSDGRYEDVINSNLNTCLNLEANEDQTGKSFIQDAVFSMLSEGCVALFPSEYETDSEKEETTWTNGILQLRVAKIMKWYVDSVEINAYNSLSGRRESIVVPKNFVAIIENPFYSVMNESNSTLQRLTSKIRLTDKIDADKGSDKLNMLMQLPYDVQSSTKKDYAEQRLSEINKQLKNSPFGIAYVGANERPIQLNRSLDSDIQRQVEYLTNLFFSQIGITQSILDGTADETTMINYTKRVVEPIAVALTTEMTRKFLSNTARSKRQTIMFFNNPFRIVPVSQIAEVSDKLTRNEIMSSNEVRQIIGMAPSKDPSADELRNKNLSQVKNDNYE